MLPRAASGAVTRTLRFLKVTVNLFWNKDFSPCSRSGVTGELDDGVSILYSSCSASTVRIVGRCKWKERNYYLEGLRSSYSHCSGHLAYLYSLFELYTVHRYLCSSAITTMDLRKSIYPYIRKSVHKVPFPYWEIVESPRGLLKKALMINREKLSLDWAGRSSLLGLLFARHADWSSGITYRSLLCTPCSVKYVFVESIITGVLPAKSDICHLLLQSLGPIRTHCPFP